MDYGSYKPIIIFTKCQSRIFYEEQAKIKSENRESFSELLELLSSKESYMERGQSGSRNGESYFNRLVTSRPLPTLSFLKQED